MRLFAILGLLVVGGFCGACASTASVHQGSLALADAPLDAGAYGSEQVRTIMVMRSEGESLARVARVVGGSRADVKRAEAAEKARLRVLSRADGPLATEGAVASNGAWTR